MQNIISLFLLMIIIICSVYYWILAIASVRKISTDLTTAHLHSFAIAIPAHDEEAVIAQTIINLKGQKYPLDMFDIYVVADYCSDRTAQNAIEHGAICFERNSGERGQKGIALKWLFERIFESEKKYDAIIVLDADTLVEENLLKYMNSRINQGGKVIQGKHIINNPTKGWISSFSWILMTIDNRFNNQGRANLNLSAKNMGDSICYRSEVLRNIDLSGSLTEDYQYRFRLLLNGILIEYEPSAIGYGQAPLSMIAVRNQQVRWRSGALEASAQYRKQLYLKWITQKKPALIDAVIGSTIPSYSTLTLTTFVGLFIHILFFDFFSSIQIYLWGSTAFLWCAYPILGLYLEKAPFRSYFALLFGPIFIIWRTWIVLKLRLFPQKITWERTPHESTRDN
jgi:cellulose synthase/poly-beta-1,6-N-acetylglucosamine synthase-like glycosyltransferase